jgi:hypothetical protein
MIRRCRDAEFEAIHAILNDAAIACQGFIPADCAKEAYMSQDELRARGARWPDASSRSLRYGAAGTSRARRRARGISSARRFGFAAGRNRR